MDTHGPSIHFIGERVAPAGAADHQTDHGGGRRAEQDQEEQADAQRGEFGQESNGRRAHQEAEIAEAADGGDTVAFADPGDAAAGGKDERDDAGESGAGGGESGQRPIGRMDQQGEAQSGGGNGATPTDGGGASDAPRNGAAAEAEDGQGGGEDGVSDRREPDARAQHLMEEHAGPIGDRALGEEDAEADGAEGEEGHGKPESAGARGGNGGGGAGARVRQQSRGRQGERQKDGGGADQVSGGRHTASGQEGARTGAGNAADAEHGVEARDGRRAQQFLGGDGLGVHGDVVGAGHGAVEEKRGKERRGVVGQRDGEQRETESGGRAARDQAAAVAHHQRAGERDGGDGADGGAQQGEPERSIAQVQRGFHAGDARYPGGDHQAVHQEARHDAQKGAAPLSDLPGAVAPRHDPDSDGPRYRSWLAHSDGGGLARGFRIHGGKGDGVGAHLFPLVQGEAVGGKEGLDPG